MKIEVEIPDWAANRVIQILVGIERVAFKFPWQDSFSVKTSRCSQCGECCKRLNNNHMFPVIDGQCVHLKKEPGNNDKWKCGLGVARPYGCCVATPKSIPGCTEKYG
jgi:hypothetical protein